MGKVITLSEARKSRPQEAETYENTPEIIIPRRRENDNYIFSERVDKAIDRASVLVLLFGVVYMVCQVFRFILGVK